MIPWISLERPDQIEEIIRLSFKNPVVIFKHSTQCAISSIAKMRLKSNWSFDSSSLPAYLLDLIQYKKLSSIISEKFDVYHESPQIILIMNGECVYDASHFDITVGELKESLHNLQIKS